MKKREWEEFQDEIDDAGFVFSNGRYLRIKEEKLSQEEKDKLNNRNLGKQDFNGLKKTSLDK